jgi:predicted flap endonuclease-1-like 5' DNA nuclease
MLLGAAILGYLIGWFRKDYKIDQMKGYIVSLEDKVNRVQSERNINERLLIDCQTEKKKVENDKTKIERMLAECQGNLAIAGVEISKLKAAESVAKINKKAKAPKKEKASVSMKEPVKEKKPKRTVSDKLDDLTIIEGIGPKIAGILKTAGVKTFKSLAKLNTEKISDILIKAGGNAYHRFDPTTWSRQAQLAAEGKMKELEELKEEMKGGRL